MVNDSIKIQDKFHFEVKMKYLLKDSLWSEYNLESYIFLPGTLSINRFTYSSEDFYKNVRHSIRFRAPEFTFDELLTSSESPLVRLQKAVSNKDLKVAFDVCEYDVKILCNVSRRTLKNNFIWLKQQKEIPFKQAIQEFYEHIKLLKTSFREIKQIIEESPLDKRFQKLFNLADEYLCILFQSFTYDLLEEFEEVVFRTNLSLKKELLDFIKTEVKHQEERKYPSIPKENDDNEEFFYRKSIFRRYFTSPLFLKPKFNKESERIQQLIFSLAAGISMLFAVLFTVIGGWGLQVGNTSSSVIAMLVIGYMFKDRIKDLGRIYISQKVLSRLYDHKWNLFVQNNPNKMGYSKEMFHFIKEVNLPELIRKIRNLETLIPVDDESIRQRIIYYKRCIKLKSNLKKSAFNGYKIVSMSDMVSFNLKPFTEYMETEDKALFVLKDDDYYKTEGDRVYHINIILKMWHESEEIYKRIRIILTQKGIKRIEHVDIDKFLLN